MFLPILSLGASYCARQVQYIVFNFWEQYSIDQFSGIAINDNFPNSNHRRLLINFTTKSQAKDSDYRQNLWVGIGFKQGTSAQLMVIAIEQVFQKYLLDESAIAGIATIDTKASDTALIEICHQRHWLLQTFSAAKLSTVIVPNPSAIITTATGTPSVAEAAAILAADNAKLGAKLLVPKNIFRLSELPGVVTVAVAQEI
ncbi:cobalamin biosynthesis protein [Nostoc sp. FACHB-87]|uniref:cobalamin biosynthesis protein n=1 Tax=Nostocales TaxID=1161 RepID=UPI001683FF61|nr:MULTISPECIES: cobalamin biosynthesis protein [Nostocales]MBD2455715.1 cobalamin biosynthesis protein [Nostoc sp. FACHB-87]MBD2477346.1 cobalamin biosynthesis protein [Anabaena sp. FACHB-83]MBD2490742.1 cobalamin biosynthesis protein [Aulosira sp. FACHB-615]